MRSSQLILLLGFVHAMALEAFVRNKSILSNDNKTCVIIWTQSSGRLCSSTRIIWIICTHLTSARLRPMDDWPLSSFHETICTTSCHLHLNKEQTVGNKSYFCCVTFICWTRLFTLIFIFVVLFLSTVL